MIKNIEMGEIIIINRREWLMVETTHKNRSIEWEQPTLVLLDKILTGINKKPYYKRNGIFVEEVPKKIFRSKKLGNLKRKDLNSCYTSV